jgi:hypothetical protein
MQKRLLEALHALSLEEMKSYAIATFSKDRPRYELLSSAKVNKSQKMPLCSQSL